MRPARFSCVWKPETPPNTAAVRCFGRLGEGFWKDTQRKGGWWGAGMTHPPTRRGLYYYPTRRGVRHWFVCCRLGVPQPAARRRNWSPKIPGGLQPLGDHLFRVRYRFLIGAATRHRSR